MPVSKDRLKILYLELRIERLIDRMKPTTTKWGKREVRQMIRFEYMLRKCLKHAVTNNVPPTGHNDDRGVNFNKGPKDTIVPPPTPPTPPTTMADRITTKLH